MVHYDGIDSFNTIDTAIVDVLRHTPTGCLAEIYVYNNSGLSSESDSENGGAGTNLNMYTGAEFSTCNATGG